MESILKDRFSCCFPTRRFLEQVVAPYRRKIEVSIQNQSLKIASQSLLIIYQQFSIHFSAQFRAASNCGLRPTKRCAPFSAIVHAPSAEKSAEKTEEAETNMLRIQ